MNLPFLDKNVTINQLIAVFQEIATNHSQINSFGYGQEYDIDAATTANFPLFWSWVQPSKISNQSIKYLFRFIICDLVNAEGTGRQQNEVQSDTINTLWDICFLLRDYYDFLIDFDINATTFTENWNNRVTGWYIDINIEIPQEYGVCDVPFKTCVSGSTNFAGPFPSSGCGSNSCFIFMNTNTTTVTGDGSTCSPFAVNVNVSARSGNNLIALDDGLYVSGGTGGGNVSSVFGRIGDVIALCSDYDTCYYPLSGNPAGFLDDADNGLSRSGDKIQLGGDLLQSTAIDGHFNLQFGNSTALAQLLFISDSFTAFSNFTLNTSGGTNILTTDAQGNVTIYNTSLFKQSVQIKDGSQSAQYVFTCDSDGVGSWQPTQDTAAAGSDGQVQFNSLGDFAASPNFTWSTLSNFLKVIDGLGGFFITHGNDFEVVNDASIINFGHFGLSIVSVGGLANSLTFDPIEGEAEFIIGMRGQLKFSVDNDGNTTVGNLASAGTTFVQADLNGVLVSHVLSSSDITNALGYTPSPTLSGTLNRITLSGNTIDISTNYVGQSSITTTGTVTNGVWNSIFLPITNTQTASYVLILSDQSKIIEMNVSASNSVTIPLNSSVAFPIGTLITIAQYGSGTTSVIATGGVTIDSSSGVLTSPGRYSPMVLEKRATNEWYLWNGLVGFTSPMTTQGDLIIGGVSGAAGRLGIGSPGDLVKVNAGATSLQYFSLNNGSILFWTTTTGLNQDNANFFYDVTNKRVGIKTATPLSPLHIQNNALGATVDSNSGLNLINSTPAINGTQQNSPFIKISGQGFGTTPATTQECTFRIGLTPIQGTAPAGKLVFDYSISGGTFSNIVTIDPSLSLLSVANGNFSTAIATNLINRLSLATINYSADTSANIAGHTFRYVSGGALSVTTGNSVLCLFNPNFTPPSGTATFSVLSFTNTVLMSGGASGAFTAIQINPVYTAAGGNVFGIDYNPTVTSISGSTHCAWRNTSGAMLIGGSTLTAATRVDQRGLGSTVSFINQRWATSGNTVIAKLTDDGTFSLNHLAGNTGIPTVTGNTGAGTSPTITMGTGSTDLGGYVNITTGSGPAGSAIVATITFNIPYASAPKSIIITPGNAATAALGTTKRMYVNQAGIVATAFDISVGSTALDAATAYQLFYQIVQ